MTYEKNIFRKVNDNRDDLIKLLQVARDYDLIKRKLDALDELFRFLKSLSWLTHEKTKERVLYYLTDGELNHRKTQAHFELDSVNRVEQTIIYASNKIKSKIEPVLNQIVQVTTVDAVDEAIQNFRDSPLQPGTYGYFIPGISRYLPTPRYDPSLSLKDCKSEFAWLGVFAHYSECLLTQFCNQGKIAHILSLLNTRSGSANERKAIQQFFDGQFSKSDSGKQQNIQKQVAQMFDWIERQNPYRFVEEDDDNDSDAN
jgi:hypothetical protein